MTSTLHWALPASRVRALALVFCGLLLTCAAWAVATPIGGQPDEPEHLVRAAAIVDGQVVVPADQPGAWCDAIYCGGASVRVPKSLASIRPNTLCLWPWAMYRRPVLPASCARPLDASHRTVRESNRAAHYEPLYYASVGLPLGLAPSASGVIGARLVNAVLTALLLATAFALSGLGEPARWWPRIGVLTGITPLVLYMGGAVNPSAWELAAGLATWMAAMRAISAEPPSRRALCALAAGGCTFAVSRPLAPIWIAVIGVIALLLAAPGAIRALVRRRDAWVAVGVVAMSCVASYAWTSSQLLVSIGAPHAAPGLSLGSAFRHSLGEWREQLQMQVGVLGWRDVPTPRLSYVVWSLLVVGLVAAALRVGTARERLALAALLVAGVVLPAYLEARQAAQVGYFWQGRYSLPLTCGIPVVAGVLLQRHLRLSARRGRRLAASATLAVAVGHLLQFDAALARYAHGGSARINPFGGSWSPPGGALVMLVLFAGGLTALAAGMLAPEPRPARQRASSRAATRPLAASAR